MARAESHDEYDPSQIRSRLLWLVGVVVWGLLAASLLSFDPADAPGHAVAPLNESPSNWIGPAGAFLAHELYLALGIGVWLPVLASGVMLALAAFRGPVSQFAFRLSGLTIVGLVLSSFHALFLPSLTTFPEGAGGLLALAGTEALVSRFGTLGATLWLFVLLAIGLTVAFDRWLLVAPAMLAQGVESLVRRPGSAAARATARTFGAARERRALARERANDVDDDARLGSTSALIENAERAKKKRSRKAMLDERAGGLGGAEDLDGEPVYEDDYEDEEDLAGAPQVYTQEELEKKIGQLPIKFSSAERKTVTQEDLDELRAMRANEEEADRNYVFPGLDLLEEPDEDFGREQEKFVREQARDLEHALRQYKVKGEVVGIESGPAITLFQVRLAPGTKVSQITSVSSDIARALKAVNVRIVPNIEGTDAVGIEVPNRHKEKVRLKELMSAGEITSKMRLPMFLGKDASGAPLIVDLAQLPHMLIAGTTGSGKSVCMNAILMGFLYTQKPSDLKLVLVDPKMVELSQFKDIPHLMCPVVTEMNKAAAILEWAVTKMDERYELLAEAGCRDIGGYNALTWEEIKAELKPQNEMEEAKIPRKLPYMVFVIDELADLMMTNKEVETSIVRIAQKARAVGIHLILATQRPQANVVTGLIKSNMPGRLSFKVASGMDSRIVLDMKGGELLLGQGDMLMITPRSSVAVRSQGTLVDDREIRRVVKFVKEVSSPTFERQLLQLRTDGGEAGENHEFGSAEEHEARMRQSAAEDPLFERAVEIIIESQRGSVSLLQRRLAIGYTRASRLIELMGMAGIIGKHKGSVAREVMMSLEQWEQIRDYIKGRGGFGARDGEEGEIGLAEDASPYDETDDDTGAPFDEEPREYAATRPALIPVDEDGTDEDARTLAEGLAEESDEDEGEEEVGEYEDADAEEDEDAELVDEDAEDDEEDDEYEYEYEYVEVDEDGEEGEDDEEYEYVDEDEDEDDEAEEEDSVPDIVTRPVKNGKSDTAA